METQPETTLIDLIRYNNWAKAQVLAATMPGAYDTIQANLGHIIYAEADYIGRMTGEPPQPSFSWKAGPSLADLSAFAGQVAGALLDAVQRISPTHLVHEEEQGQTLDYQARLLFMQAINHVIEHRTNITTILASLGLTAPEVDGWGYLFSHPDQLEVKEGSL